MKYYSILLVTFLCLSLAAQDSGDLLFDNSYLHEVRFEFSQSNFERQLSNNYQNFSESMNIPYIMASVTIDGESMDSIGVRYKGFTSYSPEFKKNPIKLDFNEFVQGQRYDGLRKLNLNNGFGDPAMQRDALCYKMLREMGVNAPRTAYAKVYFNNTYHGLYLLVEQVDKEFVQNNFANDEGNLFKNLGWSELEWLGTNKGPYADIFNLKTNREADDWSGFIELMDIINNSSDNVFESSISEVFNVDLFLKNLVVDVATNNWDSYMEHGRNWYMYEDTREESGQFHWIPWDYNFALGGDFFFFDEDGMQNCELFPSFFPITNGTKEVMFVDFSFGVTSTTSFLWEFGDGNTSEEVMPTHTYDTEGVYEVCLTLEDSENDCKESFCQPIDTKKNPADCMSIIDGTCPHEPDEVFATIIDFLPECCGEWNDLCEEQYQFWYDILGGGDFGFGSADFKIDQTGSSKVLINRLLSIEEYKERYYQLHCHLLKHVMTKEKVLDQVDYNHELILDAVKEDQNFLTPLDVFEEDNSDEGLKQYLRDRIDTLNLELQTLNDCEVFANINAGEVVINEFVASNDSIGGQADPDGGYPDWIELYNTTDMEIDLSGAFVSDNEDNLTKWQFPAGTTLAADDYLILWADDDEEQQGIHVNFKLSRVGETIFLSNADGEVIDRISYPAQWTNVAYARIPNGTGDFEFWTTTFARNNNEGMSSTDDLSLSQSVRVYPNPSSKFITIDIEGGDHQNNSLVELYNVTGQLMIHQTMNRTTTIDVRDLESGFYTVVVTTVNGMRTNKKVMVGR